MTCTRSLTSKTRACRTQIQLLCLLKLYYLLPCLHALSAIWDGGGARDLKSPVFSLAFYYRLGNSLNFFDALACKTWKIKTTPPSFVAKITGEKSTSERSQARKALRKL